MDVSARNGLRASRAQTTINHYVGPFITWMSRGGASPFVLCVGAGNCISPPLPPSTAPPMLSTMSLRLLFAALLATQANALHASATRCGYSRAALQSFKLQKKDCFGAAVAFAAAFAMTVPGCCADNWTSAYPGGGWKYAGWKCGGRGGWAIRAARYEAGCGALRLLWPSPSGAGGAMIQETIRFCQLYQFVRSEMPLTTPQAASNMNKKIEQKT